MGEDRLAIIKNKVAGISEVSDEDKKDCVHFETPRGIVSGGNSPGIGSLSGYNQSTFVSCNS